MTVASVTPIASMRQKKPRRSEAKVARAEERLTEAVGKATTPSQVVATAFDYLRIALAGLTQTDPNAAATAAWQIHQELKDHANQIIAEVKTR
jgi:hypothetical protein